MITIFCEKCGSILLPKKRAGKTYMACTCGYRQKKQEKFVIKEEIKERQSDKIEVVAKKVETLPKTKEECPKCKNPESYYWLVQTRSADEAPTRFFKCVKCHNTWRSYS